MWELPLKLPLIVQLKKICLGCRDDFPCKRIYGNKQIGLSFIFHDLANNPFISLVFFVISN